MLLQIDDFFVFLSIFGFGYLTGISTAAVIIAYNLISGNTLIFRKEEDKHQNIHNFT